MSEREAGRRALVAHVKDCIALTNECNAAILELQKAHNTLVSQTGIDVKDLQGRADALNAWAKRLERAIGAQADRTMVLLANVQDEARAFAAMTFWQRLRWLLTGQWPQLSRLGDGILVVDAATPPASGAYTNISRDVPPKFGIPMETL